MSARLYTDIKKNGDKSRFIKVAPQTFALKNFDGCVITPEEYKQTEDTVSSETTGLSFIESAQKVLCPRRC
ncbi:MAG: HTH domain-containing protein [Armatimonadota bacterium]